MKNKKAALQLSINAVVVIIIAIVMLGLALTFVRNIFGGVMEDLGEVRGEIREQMKKDLIASTEKADLNNDELTLKAGQTKEIYLGIRNYLSKTVNFCVACPNCGDGKEWCDGEEYPMGAARECSSFDDESDCKTALQIDTFGELTVGRDDVEVTKMVVKANSGANPDTYLVPIHVYGDDGESAIEEVISLTITIK